MDGFSSSCLPVFGSSDICEGITRWKLCDIGFNATDEVFHGKYNERTIHEDDYLRILQRASSVGVLSLLCTASSTMESADTLKLCRELREKSRCRLFATIGIHPTRANEFLVTEKGESVEKTSRTDSDLHVHCGSVIRNLEELIEDGLSDGVVVAIGECGLDYDRLHFSSKETQLLGFELQLEMSLKYSLPLFLHNRNTSGDFVKTITKYVNLSQGNGDNKIKGVVHSFTGEIEEMLELVSLGFMIGINGCSLKTRENLEMVKAIPLESVLIETDSPWCTIKPSHASSSLVTTQFPTAKKEKYTEGKLVKDRNEPCQLIQVLEVVAKIHVMSPLQLAHQIESNLIKLFPKIFS
jgi:TatD DNase family protein